VLHKSTHSPSNSIGLQVVHNTGGTWHVPGRQSQLTSHSHVTARPTEATTYCKQALTNASSCRKQIQGGPNLYRFKKFFHWKIAVKCILNIPLHLAYVATLPCKTLMSAKQANNDKLQGSVATYLRYSGLVNNQIKKGLLLSL